MAKDDTIKVEGIVEQLLPNTLFKVKVDGHNASVVVIPMVKCVKIISKFYWEIELIWNCPMIWPKKDVLVQTQINDKEV